MPTAEKGQIWELQVRRNSKVLAIAKGKLYIPSAEDIELFNLTLLQSVNQSVASNPFSDGVATNAALTNFDNTFTAQNQLLFARKRERAKHKRKLNRPSKLSLQSKIQNRKM